MPRFHKRTSLLVVAAALAGFLSLVASANLSVAGASPTSADDPHARRGVTLEASSTDASGGKKVALTAKVERPEGEFVVAIRRRGEHLDSGLEKTCKSETTCTAELHGSRAPDRTYAATLYRCNARGICVAEDDEDDSARVRVSGR